MEWSNFWETLSAMHWIELIAVLLALAYVLLAAAENMWCWPAAFVGSSLSTWLYIKVNLKAEAALSVFYVVMAVVGWQQWRKKKAEAATGHPTPRQEQRAIVQWPLRKHLLILLLNSLATLAVGYMLKNYWESSMPYLDAFTTVFSLFTTWMVTQKVLENWLYWVVIDVAGIYLNASRELYLFAALSALYTFIALAGYLRWRRQYYQQALL